MKKPLMHCLAHSTYSVSAALVTDYGDNSGKETVRVCLLVLGLEEKVFMCVCGWVWRLVET